MSAPASPGPIVDIVRKFDRAVDVVVTGHTHQAYVCEIDGRLVTSGDKYGTLVTAIDLKLDPATRDVVSAKADNIIVRTRRLPRIRSRPRCSTSYDKVGRADRQPPGGHRSRKRCRARPTMPARARSATSSPTPSSPRPAPRQDGGAVIAFTNPGGVRTDIARKEDGAVTYADVFASQPFRNQLVTLTLTGKQIKDMLEQQWLDPKRPRILQVSKGFSYAWDGARPDGERVLAERMSLNGQPIDPAADYRVTVNNYLVGRRRRFYGAEGRNRAAIRHLRRRCPVRLFQGQQPDRRRPRPTASLRMN